MWNVVNLWDLGAGLTGVIVIVAYSVSCRLTNCSNNKREITYEWEDDWVVDWQQNNKVK